MVGAIVRNANSGLGNLSWDFYRHGLIQKCLIVPENNGEHEFPERFGNNTRVATGPRFSKRDLDWLLDGIDSLLIFESPYQPFVFRIAKEKGVKTFFMPMHEARIDFHGSNPDVVLCVSDLEMEKNYPGEKIRINVPVDTEKVKWRLREKAEVFVHNAGHGGIGGRNGTSELVNCIPDIKSDLSIIIRSQGIHFDIEDDRVDFRYENVKNYWDLWKEGDVFVLPDKFSGLSLPLQEAFASGMLIITTDRHPLNKWLPTAPMIPVKKLGVWNNIEMALFDPEDIAKTLDAWYNKDIKEYSLLGKAFAEENSWKKLLPKYKEILTK